MKTLLVRSFDVQGYDVLGGDTLHETKDSTTMSQTIIQTVTVVGVS